MSDSTEQLRLLLHAGLVIPAHPLALDASRKFDEMHQRALTRYYCDAGSGGLRLPFMLRNSLSGTLAWPV